MVGWSSGRAYVTQPLSYRRAMVLAVGTSLLIPVVGLVTAPILTHSLGVAGRGEAGAALAPNLLIVGGATLGLPAALTFYLAKHPHLSRIALGWAAAAATLLGLLALAGVWLARPFLSAGDADLSELMIVGAWLALPALLVGLLRGAAAGRQLWRAVALEKTVSTFLRLVLLGGAALLGRLDVETAVLIMCLAPVVAGLVYGGLLRRPPDRTEPVLASQRQVARDLLGFGSQVWLGSVAIMLMARLSQLLVTPLSNVEQLGLLIVAITISDVPYIVTQTVREVIFGVNSADSDVERLLTTSRIATVCAVVGSLVLGGTLPLWIEFVFGEGFGGATPSTWLLLVAACTAVPGLIAGAAVDSAGRPGLRSVALTIALVANLVGLLLLVPPLGAVGAAIASLVSTLVSTVVVVISASRLQQTRVRDFIVPRKSDVAVVRMSIVGLVRRVRRKPEPDRAEVS
jgi:O-antigen/teichoic acid export membrane protein